MRRRALQELLGIPGKLKGGSVPRTDRLELEAVRVALGLPEPTFRAWLAPDRWVIGGAVLHWLCGWTGSAGSSLLDYDFFFPSIDAFNRGLSDLLAAGFTFSCLQLLKDRCPFCRRAGSLEPREPVRPSAVPARGCRACESTGDMGRWGSGMRLTAETLAESGLVTIDLLSPQGEVFQLAAIAFKPDPSTLVKLSDYSVCQLGMDNQHLCFGPHTWTDLFNGRLRVENLHRPSYSRMGKYVQKGFIPDAPTIARVFGFHWYLKVRDRLPRRGRSRPAAG